jgi:thioredoxin-like negative regulator of GroEL
MSDSLPLLVFFTSPRSGPARRMESLVAHVARKERDRLRVTHIDVDSRPDLAEKFSVENVPALVLVAGRKVVARLDGRASAPRIEAMLDEHVATAV